MKICFLGIGGVSMAKLAAYLKSLGFFVYGQDKTESDATRELKKRDVNVFIGENFAGVKNADIVVYSSAISESSYELSAAKALKIPVIKRAELLGMILRRFKKSIGVAGSHGKTTVTKMIATVLRVAKINFFEHVGAFEGEFDSRFIKTPEFAVCEVCEYKKNIAYVTVKTAVVLNADNDHLDSYGDVSELKKEFFNYLNRAQIKIINADDVNLKEYGSRFNGGNKTPCVYSYGIENIADYTAKNLSESGGAYKFDVYKSGALFLKIKLRVLGLHNVYNALAAIAALDLNGVGAQDLKLGIEGYAGAVRRFEKLGNIGKTAIIADYAHHPTEIKATLKTMKELYGEDYAVIFQPHTYSRTKILFDDFFSALRGEQLAIYKTYAARESYDEAGDGARLAKALSSDYFKTPAEIFEYVKNGNKKAVLIMGAGDIYDEVKKLL